MAESSKATRNNAIIYINETLKECEGSCDLGVVLGAAGMAERLGLITHEEFNAIHTEAFALNKAYENRRKEEYKQRAEQKKAERAAAAKKAKGAL